FEPVLVEGKAIQIHPLVCTAFNADFDGDQMAVHLPLSAQAQAEARVLMLSANNVLSPAHGRPLVTPGQDMIIGAYYLTEEVEGAVGEGRIFRHQHQIERAYEAGEVELHARIEYRIPQLVDTPANGDAATYTPTTVGRVLFNSTLPDDFPYVNRVATKRDITTIVDKLAQQYTKEVVARSLDALKNLSFQFASQSGLTVSVDDIKVPHDKKTILDGYEKEADKVERQFRRGIITDGERRQKEVEIWTEATEVVRQSMESVLKSEKFNPIDMMVGSGARGNMMQVRQIAGMRGLVANPRGDMIPRPIKSNFREGLAMLEYFIATPGARKGLVDTALRTADSGYLTRRLVDVAQEVIINDRDPFESGGPVRGIWINDVMPDEPGKRTYLETRLFSRTLADDVALGDGTVLERGSIVGDEEMALLRDDPTVTRVRVLSPLTDDSEVGISRASYGLSLATGQPIEVGEAVGVIAAQSIGEPGTQLTMRTFHTGGVAGKDIAGGLPRVVELFEARTPKGKAELTRISGVVRLEDEDGKASRMTVVGDDGAEWSLVIDPAWKLAVTENQEVSAGDSVAQADGPRDPKELLEIRGVRETQQYLVDEVQRVYRDQGVSIHDKHIELIVRQMTRRVAIQEPGDSDFLPGERVDSQIFTNVNRALAQEGKRPAEGRPELMGITKASLATDSWLSAASFQETTRVLTEAAIESRQDKLVGLKENIIIGKLIPAGTGMEMYREIATRAPDFTPMEYYTSADEDVDLADQFAQWASAADAAEADVLPMGNLGA
ncbi:MAG: DNA-directed RNA polymerase subunit beta', partial [Acidimicrobiia bacterium]|nr:DNA-directed RNA polymerase subunit beta' [Acidimicrobiia bacterium]